MVLCDMRKSVHAYKINVEWQVVGALLGVWGIIPFFVCLTG